MLVISKLKVETVLWSLAGAKVLGNVLPRE
jgi:hypothetical protein